MIKLIMDAMLISIFWFIALYSLKLDRIQQLINNRVAIIFNKKTILFSKVVVLILIFFEFLMILGGEVGVFIQLKHIISLPVSSHFIYLTSLFVLFISTMQISRKLIETEKFLVKAERRAVSFISGLLVVSISVILFYFQSVYWGELKYIYTKQGQINLVLEGIIDGFLILIPGIMIMINAIRYLRKIQTSIAVIRSFMPIVIFMACTQTIITKLVVFYDFFIYSYQSFSKQFGIRIKNDYDDKLFIVSSLSSGNINAKVNTYFLLAYFSTILVLWNSQISPLPIQSTVYSEGLVVSLFFTLGILFFWIYESLARSFSKWGNSIRNLFIPTILFLTIFPFFSKYANMNYFVRPTEVVSIYQKMSLALGSNKVLFFMCLVLIQASLAYILHLVTGEANNNQHYFSILPVLFIVQIMVLSFCYPIFLLIPPYYFYENQLYFVIGIVLSAIVLTLIMGHVAYYFFTSPKSKWTTVVHDYWKNKSRVLIITAIATAFTTIPINSFIIEPIRNINIETVWEKDMIQDDKEFHVNAFFQSTDLDKAYILQDDGRNKSKIVVINTLDGKILWEKEFQNYYIKYKVWQNDTVVLIKAKNMGFTILDLKTGYIQYDYKIKDEKELEQLKVDVNDRTVLFSTDKRQFVYDLNYGILELDIIGNNYFELIPGNQCAVIKNEDIYLYQQERWEKLKGVYSLYSPELLYYNHNGLIVFNKENIVRYNYNLTKEDTLKYNKTFEHVMSSEDLGYVAVNDEVPFYLHNREKVFAYIFDTMKFTYKKLPLEQRVKDYNDYQEFKICDDQGSYFLYDDYQFTLYKNENIYARQWYQIPPPKEGFQNKENFIVGSPIKSGDKILWIERNGKAHCVNTVIQ